MNAAIRFDIPIRNNLYEPVKIVGLRSDCSCTESDLPFELKAREERLLTLRWGLGEIVAPGPIAKEVSLVHDHVGHAISLLLIVQIEESEK